MVTAQLAALAQETAALAGFDAPVLTDDLRGAGHVIVPGRDGRLVGSELEKFWVQSVPGIGGWTTTAQVEMNLEVGPPPGAKRRKASLHSCTRTEHSLGAPGEPELSALLMACVKDLVHSVRGDAAWAGGATAAR